MNQLTYVDVPLTDIDLGDRKNATGPAVEAMMKDIKEVGLLFPVLLTRDLLLVDGRTRVAAFVKMGMDSIPAYIPERFPEAIDYLASMNRGEEVPYGRMGEMMVALRPMMMSEAKASRARSRWHEEHNRSHERARFAYARAFSNNPVIIAKIQGLYMSVLSGKPGARELAAEMAAGTITPHVAYARLYARPFFDGDVSSRGAQENLLRNTAQHLSAVVMGLTKLKSPIKARPEVVQECLEELRLARATLISSIRELEKETKQA